MSRRQVRMSPVLTMVLAHPEMSWRFAADAHVARAVRMIGRKVIL
ncbi:MAG: hypothetical protein RL739_1348 [Pseudomonadota bacterium]|jgi:hypothetical protein